MIVARLRRWGELVAFSHTIFMMPFAAAAVALATAQPHAPMTAIRIGAIVLCMVSARTSAMAFNRWADRDVDAKNPRTANRPVPSGRISAKDAIVLTVISGIAFIGFATTLGLWTGVLSVPVLAILLGYSLAKRFTWAAHAWLGLALGLAPGGAWLAMGAQPNAGIVCLMAAVLTWLFGFDVLYALQDEHFDREEGLRSVPARFGAKRAMRMSGFSHVLTVTLLAACGHFLARGPVFFVGVGIVAIVLVIEHRLIRGANGGADMSKIGKVFFDCNAYVSLAFFVTTLADRFLRG